MLYGGIQISPRTLYECGLYVLVLWDGTFLKLEYQPCAGSKGSFNTLQYYSGTYLIN